MTALLLDHPWPIEDNFDAGSPAFGILLRLSDLIREQSLRVGVRPARFIMPGDLRQALTKATIVKASGLAAFKRFAEHCVRDGGTNRVATPEPEPPLLTDQWKQALRESLGDLSDWRDPQIIVSTARLADWRNEEEVAIACEGHPDSNGLKRVVACLDSYEAHTHATSDLDPWDLRRRAVSSSGAERVYPCYLPKPPQLTGVPLKNLRSELEQIRNWEIGGGFYFIPNQDWDPTATSQEKWRKGRVFPEVRCRNGARWPCDYKGEAWCWDEMHGHWDVQRKKEYWCISQSGRRIAIKKRTDRR